MKDNSDLFLVLTRQWFDMIEAKIKTDEYRDITHYWIRRLVSFADYPEEEKGEAKKLPFDMMYDFDTGHVFSEILKGYFAKFKDFKTVTFQHGYAKNANRMQFEFKGIEVGRGNPDWGAEEGVYYFVIHLGKRIDS